METTLPEIKQNPNAHKTGWIHEICVSSLDGWMHWSDWSPTLIFCIFSFALVLNLVLQQLCESGDWTVTEVLKTERQQKRHYCGCFKCLDNNPVVFVSQLTSFLTHFRCSNGAQMFSVCFSFHLMESVQLRLTRVMRRVCADDTRSRQTAKQPELG